MSDSARFEDFARISADWLWETDTDDRFGYFSVPLTKSGVDLDSGIGLRRLDGAAREPDDLARVAAVEEKVARREPFRDFIYRQGFGTGQLHWCSISGEPRHDSAGAFLGYRGVGRDVTAQVNAQQALEIQSRTLQAILRATPDGVHLVDKSLATLAVNDQLYEILGLPNRAGEPDAESPFLSLIDLAVHGEYGEGDPETLARERVDSMIELVGAQPNVTYQRQLKTGRWVEARLMALEDNGILSLHRDITDAKEREAELGQQAVLLSTIVSNLDGIVVYDKDTRLSVWNDRFADLVGVDPSMLKKGVTARDLLISQAKAGEFGPCDAEAEADHRLAAFFNSERVLVHERKRPNGRVVEMRRHPVPGGGSVAIYVDITARKQAERGLNELNATLESRILERTAALAETERFQRALLGNLPGMVYRSAKNATLIMEFASEGCRRVLGMAPEDLIRDPVTYAQLIHPDDRDPVRDKVALDFSAGRRFALEYRVRHADGSWRWVWHQARPIFATSGEPEAMEGYIFDITERKVAEQELARAKDNLSDAIESVNHGIMLYDREGRLVLFNRRGLDQYPDSGDAIKIGMKIEDILGAVIERGQLAVPSDPGEQDFVAERVARLKRADGTVTELRLPDGRVLYISEQRTGSGGTVSSTVDVTERVRIEERLRDVQRMEAIGHLSGGLAHDLNNYLATIMGNLDLLADEAKGDPESSKLIEAALAGAQRSADLTRSLLAFSRRQPLNPKSLDVGERIGHIARLIKRTIGEKVVLDVRRAPDLWPVEIDGAQLDIAIVNLANNARDSLPGGGTLTIDVRNAEPDNAESPAGDHVLIEVMDTGSGMDAATLARAFEPFFSTKGPGHGTGLGLSMVHGFVHQTGGAIRLISTLGEGTTVQLFLPRTLRRLADRPGQSARPVLPRATESVLLVDDDADVRAIVAIQLASLGYRVVEADCGTAALSVLASGVGDFDLVVTDMIMPGKLDGPALARIVRDRWPRLGVLLTTGFAGNIDDTDDGGMKTFGVLRKPYRKAELARAIRAALTDASDREGSDSRSIRKVLPEGLPAPTRPAT